MRLPRWFGSRLVISAALVVLVALGIQEYRHWTKRRAIQREIDSLTAQQQEIEAKNKELEDSLSFLNTQGYKEKVAREQLNMQKEGELVVNFPANLPEPARKEPDRETNPQKWWRYFFHRNTN